METIELDPTKAMIMEQLLENTGRALGDSGDAYGRGWQRDAGKTWEQLADFDTKLEAHVYTHKDKPELELLGYVNVAKWLEANLEYSPFMQGQFEAYVKSKDPEGEENDMTYMEDFATWINQPSCWNRNDVPSVINTYNGDCDLTRTLQFITFTCDDEDGNEQEFVLLQTHNGCDVRGGYSSPKAYKVNGDWFGRWGIDGYSCASKQWDEDLSDSNTRGAPSLKDYAVHKLEWVSTLEHDLECLKQTDKDTEEIREAVRVGAITAEREAFEEFCGALTEHSVVVFKRKAYFVGDEGPEEIFAECCGLFN